MILRLLGGLWGKFATLIVGAVALLAAVLRIRYKVRKGAQEEMRAEIQERTLERIKTSQEVDADVDDMSDGDILDKLRDNGWIRD